MPIATATTSMSFLSDSEGTTSLSKAIVSKIAHPHIMMIKKNGSPLVLDVMKGLFQVEENVEEDDEKEMDTGDKGE